MVQPQWRGVWQSQQDDVHVASVIRKISGSSPKGTLAKNKKRQLHKDGESVYKKQGDTLIYVTYLLMKIESEG